MRPSFLLSAAFDDDSSGGGTCRISRRKNMFCSAVQECTLTLTLSPLSSSSSFSTLNPFERKGRGTASPSHFLPFLHLFSSLFLRSFVLSFFLSFFLPTPDFRLTTHCMPIQSELRPPPAPEMMAKSIISVAKEEEEAEREGEEEDAVNRLSSPRLPCSLPSPLSPARKYHFGIST